MKDMGKGTRIRWKKREIRKALRKDEIEHFSLQYLEDPIRQKQLRLWAKKPKMSNWYKRH